MIRELVKNFFKEFNFISFRKLITLSREIFILFHIKQIKNPADINKILVVRRGGIGDLLFISTSLKFLKEKNPAICITLMTESANKPVARLIPCINHVVHLSWRFLPELLKNDTIVFLDSVLERDIDWRLLNIYDLIANKYFLIELPQGHKKPYIRLDPVIYNKLPTLIGKIKADNEILIGIQVLSNSPARTPSVDYWSFVINYLAKNIPNSLFFIIIEKKHEATYHELTKRLGNQVELNRIINTTNYFNSLSGLFEFIPLLNIVITPDSSVIHIAEGFGIPGVGLYGPYPSSLRTSSYKNCISLDTELNCAPCFILGHSPCTEALKLNKINSPCMESFSPEKILQAVNELLDKK